jgi:hypothetical protein
MWVSFAVGCVMFFNLPLQLGLWQVCYVDDTVSTLPIVTMKDILWTTTFLLHTLQYLHRQQPCFERADVFSLSEKCRVKPQGGSIHKIRGLGQDGSEVQPSILRICSQSVDFTYHKVNIIMNLGRWFLCVLLRVRGILHL